MIDCKGILSFYVLLTGANLTELRVFFFLANDSPASGKAIDLLTVSAKLNRMCH
jgi:hypothetical protein